MKYVKVTHQLNSTRNENLYTFKVRDDLNLEFGNLVVCQLKNGDLVLARVIVVDADPSTVNVEVTSWVIDKVSIDLEKHRKMMERERQQARLKAEMIQRKAELAELESFRRWAEGDSVMKGLLKEYEDGMHEVE